VSFLSIDRLIDLPCAPTATPNPTYATEGKPLSSPSTNLEFSAEMAILAPNVRARGQLLEFKAATTREWEALQREWEEATGGAGRG
jgi:hypothetical protein